MSMGGWGVPGVGADRSVTESVILWGADQARNGVLWQSGLVSGAARDAGNTPTTVLRPGLILGKITATGKLKEWDVTSTDGSQFPYGILDTELRAQDFDATDADRVFRVIVGRAPVKAALLLIGGTALTSATDQYLARRALVAAGCVFDDDPQGWKAGVLRWDTKTGTTHSPTAADNGTVFFYSNAGAVAVTLPTLVPGLEFTFIRTANEELAVASAAGDDIVVGNDLSADSITFTTAGEQIGAAIRVRSAYVGGTLKWISELPYTPFGVGTATMTFGLAT